MYTPTRGYMTGTRNITWLHCMYYGKPETSNEVVMYPQMAIPFKLEGTREGATLNASESKMESKDKENKWSTVHL